MDSSEALNNILNDKLIEESKIEFKINKKEKEYLIEIGKSCISEKLGIKVIEFSSVSNFYYENFFTLEKLQKINIAFFAFKNIDDIILKAKDIFEEKKISIKYENMNMLLNVSLYKDGNLGETISFELKPKTFTAEEICLNLYKQIIDLKGKMAERDKENKNNINELKNEIKLLKNEINELKKGKDLNKVDGFEIVNSPNNTSIPKETINENVTIDSKILIKKQEIVLITNRLRIIDKYKNKQISYRLLYRKSKDGDQAINFHQKCDGVPKTISIFETVKGRKFGGYIDKAWSSNGGWIKNDELCFIFSVDLMKIYNPVNGMDKYYFHKNYGPNFSEFGLYNHIVGKNSFILSVNLKNKDDANKYFSGFNQDFELNGGENKFQIQELEVYQVIFQ
jgi:hypothetical protein